jgi:hypothetical protein
VVADMRSDIEDEITRLHEPAVQPCERALNSPQLWAANFPQFCRGG